MAYASRLGSSSSAPDVDPELQDLYNAVWAGYDAKVGTSVTAVDDYDEDGLYSSYPDRNVTSSTTGSAPSIPMPALDPFAIPMPYSQTTPPEPPAPPAVPPQGQSQTRSSVQGRPLPTPPGSAPSPRMGSNTVNLHREAINGAMRRHTSYSTGEVSPTVKNSNGQIAMPTPEAAFFDSEHRTSSISEQADGRWSSSPTLTRVDSDFSFGDNAKSGMVRNMSHMSTSSYMSGYSSATYDSSNTYNPGPSSSLATTPHQSVHSGESDAASDITSRLPVPQSPQHHISVDAYTAGSVPLQASYQNDEDFAWDDLSDHEDDGRFVNFALLSNIAVRLRDKVPRGTHTKGNVPYASAFTGKDIVSTIQNQIQRELLMTHNISTSDRRTALQMARSLQSQLFFDEVEWEGSILQDGVEGVYMFSNELDGHFGAGTSDAALTVTDQEELPTGVMTFLTNCYSSSCVEGNLCYVLTCPRRGTSAAVISPSTPEIQKEASGKHWKDKVPANVIQTLPESEIERQETILSMVAQEEQYLADLDSLDEFVIQPLRKADPPVVASMPVEDFIDQVFGNLLDLQACNQRLLEAMHVRQREEGPIVQRIGDIFLNAATEFRLAYPTYMGNLPAAEKLLKDEQDSNPDFRLFLEESGRQLTKASSTDTRRFDVKHALNRPALHLKQYAPRLDAISGLTAKGNSDIEYLRESIKAINNLGLIAKLTTFQMAMCRGPSESWGWHDIVDDDVRKALPKAESSRQGVIFELIKGEMEYVKDLENLELMFIIPLREADPPIIPRARLEQFLLDVFDNFADLHFHHRKLLEKLHQIQREEHPVIKSITAAMFDAALHFRPAYMEYVPNYPIAEYRIIDEMNNNPAFKMFVHDQTRHPDARRLDMKSFVNRPIPRLLRYSLLLEDIRKSSPEDSDDRVSIPQVLDILKSLGKDTEPGVGSAKQKVELWNYNANITFKTGEMVDMDLLNEHRSLIHAGRLLRQPEGGFEFGGWTDLWVILFDNYLVMTKSKEKDGVTTYQVNRRPIPLDLLTLVNFTDPPTVKSSGLLRRGKVLEVGPLGGSTSENPVDTRSAYPCTIHHNGRVGGLWTTYAESSAIRTEWKNKLEEALGLRKVVQESNKVFEIETLSIDTFLAPSIQANTAQTAWNQENSLTGKVTCSVPFSTSDDRALVAIGCAEGVWIGLRHDSKSMRRVLHLKQVTQCAMLEEFGIFLVLADKSLFAYHIEALVPSSTHSVHASQTPQKLNGNKDVHFFSVGTLSGRTLVIYMKKKGIDSVFRVLEPLVGKINEKIKAPPSLSSRLGIRAQKSDWFRIYRDFFLPSESFDLMFLKAKIAILCPKGFEIMDLSDLSFKSVTIPLPQRDNPVQEKLARRCESCRPLGMFKVKDDFLLCYNEFGLYVDKHGMPSRENAGVVEWEGTAEHVALHPPYVLMFDPRFIEVRFVDTGRLAQIIPGNDVRCLWDGRSNATTSINSAAESDQIPQEPRVHAVMNAKEPPGNLASRKGSVTQHVFELMPTIPLFPPESTAAPFEAVYHSPQGHLRSPTDSWR